MNFDRWVELITVILGLGGGAYAVLRVLLQPLMIKIDNLAKTLQNTSSKLEEFIKGQNDLHDNILLHDNRIQRLEERFKEVEDFIDELR